MIKKPQYLLIASLVVCAVWIWSLVLARPVQVITSNQVPVVLAQADPSDSVHVPVLMYHHVGYLTGNDALVYDLTVSPNDFESQLNYFRELGYHSVSIEQIYSALEFGTPLPVKPIAITFDDGYKDVFQYAVPILQKNRFVGSFAVIPNLIGTPGYATWDDIIESYKSGMEIVSHSKNHLDLINTKYSPEELRQEIFNSKQILEEKLNTQINFFVYPYGHNNEHVQSLVKEAGYKLAFTTEYGQDIYKNNAFAAPRVRVHGQNGLEKLKTIFSPKSRSVSGLINP